MAREISKAPRSKNFSQDEIITLVDLLEINKSTLFGALRANITMDAKNEAWKEIAVELSELHGHARSRDEVSKKWYNILSKHKPRIADKLASAKRTGGGAAEAALNALELKIIRIKGREYFEEIESGIDLSLSSSETVDENALIVSPVPSQSSQQKCFPMKRRVCEDNSYYEEVKKKLVGNEEEKKGLLISIDLKLEDFDSKQERIISLLERIASNQSKLISLVAPQPAPSHNPPPAILPTSTFHLQSYYSSAQN